MHRYPIYKGLQKPLSYRGFKGKFIYWGIGFLVLGLLSGGVIGAFTNKYLGGLLTCIFIVAGLFYTFQRQKKGLFSKTRTMGVFVHPAVLKKRKHEAKKVRI